ncbi:sarcosine oxidase subunit gamma [Microbacterium sp. A196]|uniref:sarcosine oxidase subunit gamma n=1 Tax=Microbacterium sp. A196 TaxID=3457320 RepID=UPI003FCEF881
MVESTRSPAAATARISPAGHLAVALDAGSVPGVVEVREEPFLTMIGVRVTPRSAAAERIAAVAASLPEHSGETSEAGSVSVLWLGPQEFLVVASPEHHREAGGTLELDLLAALGADPGQIVDLSANRTTFELIGRHAVSVLRKGCGLDLHPRFFAVGAAVPTEVGGVAVILWRTAEMTYRIMPRASFSEFTVEWLLDAMREFGSPSTI